MARTAPPAKPAAKQTKVADTKKPIEKTKANIKNKSPILFRNKALILAILASILVYQKFTNK